MPGVGPTDVDFMFVGHAPGGEDDGRGQPMTGNNGRLFRELLGEAGINANNIFITNCLKCCLFDKKPKEAHFLKCKYHLQQEIRQVKPRAIVAVGAQALEWLTGQYSVKRLRKQCIPCQFDPSIMVYALQQPASIFHAEDRHKKTVRAWILDDLLWLKNTAAKGELGTSAGRTADYKTAETMADVNSFIEEIESSPGPVSVDFETGTREGKGALFPDPGCIPMCMGFSTGPFHGRAIPLYAWGIERLFYWEDAEVEQIINRVYTALRKKEVFGHNFVQFDTKWTKAFGNIDDWLIKFDTFYGLLLMDEEGGKFAHDLEGAAMIYTDMAPWKKMFTLRDTMKMCEYQCKDVDATFRLRLATESQLDQQQRWLLENIMLPLGHELRRMELRGALINSDNIAALGSTLQRLIDDTYHRLRAIPAVKEFELANNVTLNVQKADQVAKIMEQHLHLPCLKRTDGGKYSTDVEVLTALADHDFVADVLRMRRLGKLKGTFCDGMHARTKVDGCVHTSYNEGGTVTGRLSSSDPNLQQIPRKDTAAKVLDDGSIVKSIFVARPGYCFVQGDLSQAELRTIGMYSHDPVLCKIFADGLDPHAATAAEVYHVELAKVTKSQRTDAKHVNFGVPYGMHESSVAQKFVDAAVDQWRKSDRLANLTALKEEADARGRVFYRTHKTKFPVMWDWLAQQEEEVRKFRQLQTYFGRRRRFAWIDDHALRQAFNFKIQSTASDFTLLAIINIANKFREFSLDAHIVLTVHDSILVEAALKDMWAAAWLMKHEMERNSFPDFMSVPLLADMEAGFSWGKLKPIDVEAQKVLAA